MEKRVVNLRQPVQGKGRVENIDGPSRKKPPIEGSGDSGGKVGAVVVGGKAFFHAFVGMQHRREELKEGVEIIARQVGEESRELRRAEA